MSSPAILASPDDDARLRALDSGRSFVVRAPAGSGKTELLIRRFLKLLSVVHRPELVVAITFTRKAAGEMLDRITGALRDARLGTPVDKPHLAITRELALAALDRDRENGWDLLVHPGRLRVQTIDSLCMAITGEMPWLARLGGMPGIEDDASLLYEEAARRTLLDESPSFHDALTALLRHLGNDATRASNLIALMLARRDQWLPLIHMDDASERARLEATLAGIVAQTLSNVDHRIPVELRNPWIALAGFRAGHLGGTSPAVWPAATPECAAAWACLADTVLTKDHRWRKSFNVKSGFPPGSAKQKDQCASLIDTLQDHAGLREGLEAIQSLPPSHFANDRWNVLRPLLQSLRLAMAHLKLVFRERLVIDFIELGTAAREALGSVDNPTELAFRLDARIEHLLVDEFQDTSRVQFELLTRLTTGWQPGDGRTLFVVGDPMQSIYRFRQAEVGLFLETESNGVGGLPLEPLRLQLNRRSRPAIVNRVNELEPSFPGADDPETGAIKYTSCSAEKEGDGGEVTFDGFLKGDCQPEAECVIRRVRESVAQDPQGTIAILVRARTHLFAITEALKSAEIPYQAVDIEPLASRAVVQDLLALTRALLDPADRIAWLAILRAPWCGLALGDLEALVRGRLPLAIEECLRDLAPLSDDGRARATRLREILAEALAEQGRWPLRRWVERVWMKLGGPTCLAGSSTALDDAAAFFDLLEVEQSGAGLDFSRFHRRVTDLYAQPRNRAEAGGVVQVMTIHKAKGLEFDTVIVPGLGRLPQRDDAPLVLFHERRSGGQFECLLAPIDETGDDPLYRYLRDLEHRQAGYERTRLLYVAATRARNRLHLMGQALDKNGSLHPPAGSMLFDLWPALSAEEQASCLRNHVEALEPAPRRTRSLRRLPASWRLPEFPRPVAWEGQGQILEEPHQPGFEWAGETLRHAGAVVHTFLQRMPNLDRIPNKAAIRRAVAHAGVAPTDIDAAAQQVRQALERIAASPRGRWILAARKDMRTEYAVTGVFGGEIVSGRVDRTFIEDGVRWVVDFKTSAHEGGSLGEFLDEQQRRYRDQMERYARILAPLGNPVRLGLYFPLLDGWREWSPEAEA